MRDASRGFAGAAGSSGAVSDAVSFELEVVFRGREPAGQATADDGGVQAVAWEHLVLVDAGAAVGLTGASLRHAALGSAQRLGAPPAM